MATGKLTYATVASITITQTSLGSGNYRESTAVDNTTNRYIDAHVGGITQIGAVGATTGQSIEVYAYGTYDGTNYTAGLTGSDAAITWGTGTSVLGYLDLRFLGSVAVEGTDDNDDRKWGPFSVRAAFGGVLPLKWGIVIRNNTDVALHATGTNNEVQYIGITVDIT